MGLIEGIIIITAIIVGGIVAIAIIGAVAAHLRRNTDKPTPPTPIRPVSDTWQTRTPRSPNHPAGKRKDLR